MNLIFFLRSGSARSRKIKISEHAVLNQSPNFKGSENTEVNKMSMQLNFCFHFINTNPVISVEVLKLWNRYCW